MKLVLLALSVIYCAALNAQNRLELPDNMKIDSLLEYLHNSIAERKSIETDEIKDVHKLTFWQFVPSLNYDFISDRYYLSISSGAFVTNMINRRQEKKKTAAIERRFRNKEESETLKLKFLYITVLKQIENIKMSRDILDNDIEIFYIKKQQYAANEIDTEQFLKEKGSILLKVKQFNVQISELQINIYEIEKLIEKEIGFDLSEFFVVPNFL